MSVSEEAGNGRLSSGGPEGWQPCPSSTTVSPGAGVHSEAHSHLPLPWWQAQRAAGWEGPLESPAKLVWGPAQAFISCATWSRSQCIC